MMMKRLVMMILAGGLVATGPLGCSDTPDDPQIEDEQDADADPDAGEEDAGDEDASEDDAGEPDAEDPDADAEDPIEQAAMPLRVKVLNKAGLPVEGAEVRHGEEVLLSDGAGEVLLGAPEEAERFLAQVQAEGYAPSSLDYPVRQAEEGAEAHAIVRLLPLGPAQVFNHDAEAVISRGRVRVRLPANSLIDGEGNPVTGEVEATIASLDPTTEDARFMPGPLIGLPEGGGAETPILSVMMADISFWQDGEKLQLAEGQLARVEFVIPEALEAYEAGDAIEFWHFDLSQARWVQEGECAVAEAGSQLLAECDASHFSWWNADKPVSLRNCVNITVVDADTGEPIPGAILQGEGLDFEGAMVGSGLTDADGQACMDFLLDGTLNVGAYHADYLYQAGGPVTVSGSDVSATCAGDGQGQCVEVTVELLDRGTCLSGEVLDGDDAPVEGATVFAVYDGAVGAQFFSAVSDSEGGYCIEVPLDAELELSALDGQGQVASGVASTVGAAAAECGEEGCAEADALVLGSGETACLQSSVSLNGWTTPAPGVPVYVYSSYPARSCDPGMDDPFTWGPVVAHTVTDAMGNWALNVPMSLAGMVYVSVGSCHSGLGAQCLNQDRIMPVQLEEIPGSIDSGRCQQTHPSPLDEQCLSE
ncbi:hypothetical protein FRC98_11440 [Lujinxingia vulgaris]|uniref:Carboxypeptidase regulatory-like domain-containing protein n=1 Tax=Lujinxingia vulgaris TaxID=2600176 RepID=A0A5C6XIH3_9DELT|nr:carboxypeptidase-like regulatory domain-containing protein [Lujinxingia vulgaris]TXD37335.1 hypothetical protein FRC98_11440 [Lujinxingia vulgaris]